MNVVELYTTQDCGLCREAKTTLTALQKEFPFRIEEVLLTETHPKYNEYVLSVPVVIVNGGKTLSGKIEEAQLRELMRSTIEPSRVLTLYKFLEALGFVTIGVGLFYGVTRNDEWQELYFFLAGILVFGIGRILERRELKRARR